MASSASGTESAAAPSTDPLTLGPKPAYTPAGYTTVCVYMTCEDANGLLLFLTSVFDAKERMKMTGENGNINHCEVCVGESLIMLGTPPEKKGASKSKLMVYVENADATYEKALKNGATSVEKPTDKFYGDRMAAFTDMYGNEYFVAHRIEDVSPEELQKRATALEASMKNA